MASSKGLSRFPSFLAVLGVVLLSGAFFYLAREVIHLQGFRSREWVRRQLESDSLALVSRFQVILERSWAQAKEERKKGDPSGGKGWGARFFRVDREGVFLEPRFPRYEMLPPVDPAWKKKLADLRRKARSLSLENKPDQAYSLLKDAWDVCPHPSGKALLRFWAASIAGQALAEPVQIDFLEKLVSRYPGARKLDGAPLAPLAAFRLASLYREAGQEAERKRVLGNLLRDLALEAWPMDAFMEDYLLRAVLKELAEEFPPDLKRWRRTVILVRRYLLPLVATEGWRGGGGGGPRWKALRVQGEPVIAGFRKVPAAGGPGLEGVVLDARLISRKLTEAARSLFQGGGFILRTAGGDIPLASAGREEPGMVQFEKMFSGEGMGVFIRGFAPIPLPSRAERTLPWIGLLLIVFALGGGTLLSIRSLHQEIKLGRMRREFMDSVSHELRTPITSILLNAELLQREGLPPERAALCVRQVKEEAMRLEKMVSDILDISRMQRAGTSWMRPERVLPGDLLDSTLLSYASLLQAKGFEVSKEIEPGLPPVMADRDAASRALGNLLGNAVKYSGDSREILLRARREGRMVAIDVVDHGVGVPPGEEEKIFQRFYRVRNNERNIPGVGLGLAVARELVRGQGGEIRVSRTEGGGSTFTLVLPAAS